MFNTKKRYFKKIGKEVQRLIWEKELSKFTQLQKREIIRQQYDSSVQALASIKARIDGTPATETIPEELKSQKEQIEKAVALLKASIDGIDETINGTEPTEANPNGVKGLTAELQDWVNRKETIKAFIKYNC